LKGLGGMKTFNSITVGSFPLSAPTPEFGNDFNAIDPECADQSRDFAIAAPNYSYQLELEFSKQPYIKGGQAEVDWRQ
jgi:hypothetical protein